MGFRIPLVEWIKRRRKARPGTTTQQAKLRSPIKDCSSFRVTLFREQKSASWVRHSASLSSGRRASIKAVSKVIPANCKALVGPIVFSSAIGTPIRRQTQRKLSRSTWHFASEGPINKKSSKICMTDDTRNLSLAIHSNEFAFSSRVEGRG